MGVWEKVDIYSMYIYDILMNLIASIRNLFHSEPAISPDTPRELTEHQQNRVERLRKEIDSLKKTNALDLNLNLNKMYQEMSKINRRINRQTDFVIIIKFIENELRDFKLMKQLEPEIHEITVELIEKNTKLLDLKAKFNVLLEIKEKEDKINRIMYGV